MTQRSVNRKGWGTRDTDVLVSVTSNDTTAGYLNPKIAPGAGLTTTVLNPGANEQLQIAVTSLPASLQPQWIPAGCWTSDPANSINLLQQVSYGASPGGTYSIYDVLEFPQAAIAAQYWYFTTAPPLSWTSTKIKYRVHFIVEDTISLPGRYSFQLGARRQQDVSAVSGNKQTLEVEYTLADTNIPRYRITDLSCEITIASAAAGEGLHLELTRLTNAVSDESDPAYVVGVEIHYV